MAGQVVVQFDARNNVSPVLKKIRTDSGQLEKALNGGTSALGKTRKGFSGAGVAAQGASKGVAVFGTAFKAALGPIGAALAAIGGLSAAFKTIAAQDFAIAKVESLGVNSKELVTRLKEVSAELNGQASVVELTGAAYDVASAGFANAADAAKVLKAASLGATGGFGDLGSTAKAATAVLNAYGSSADDAGRLVDQFIQTQNDGVIVVAEYAQNIGKVASAAAGLKVPLGEVNAVIAQATASGVQSDVAFTGLKTALAQLASGDATNRMKELGINIDAGTIAADGLLGTFKKIKNSGADTGKVFKLLGAEAGPALLPVLNNLEKFEQLLENQKNSAGVASKAQARAADTINGAYKRLSTAIQNTFSDQAALGTLIKTVFKAGAFAVEVLNEVMGNFQEALDPVGKSLQKIFKDVDFKLVANIVKNVLVTSMSQIANFLKIILPLSMKVVELLVEGLKRTPLAFIIGKAYEVAKAFGLIKIETERVAVASNKVKNSTDEIADATATALALKKELSAQNKINQEQIKTETIALEGQNKIFGLQIKAAQSVLAITQARNKFELSALKLEESRLQRQLNKLQSIDGFYKKQRSIIDKIAKNRKKQAQIEFKVAQQSIRQMVHKSELEHHSVKSQVQKINLQVELLRLQAEEIQNTEKKLETLNRINQQAKTSAAIASQMLMTSNRSLNSAREIAKFQKLSAQHLLDGKLESIEAERVDARRATHAASIAKSVKAASSATSSGLSSGLSSGSSSSAGSSFRPGSTTTHTMSTAGPIDPEVYKKVLDRRPSGGYRSVATLVDELNKGMGYYGDGGHVSGAQLAMIGEKGPEYVIPEKKAASFATNYLMGARGASAIPGYAEGGYTGPINIQTGPVMQQDNQMYLTMSQFEEGMQELAESLARGGRSYGSRQFQGVS